LPSRVTVDPAGRETRSLAFVFEVPTDFEPGVYTIDVGVFNGNWSKLYTYRFIAARFTVE
jgi:hypothetical protein